MLERSALRVAVIPARGGSVRVPLKNIKPFAGRPIIAYSIECAKDSGLFSRIIVSTDHPIIEKIALDLGAEVHRRAKDDGFSGTQYVTKKVLEEMDVAAKYACCIYATAPLLLPRDLHAGFSSLTQREAAFAFGVGTEPLRDAGAFYCGRLDAFLDQIPLIGPRSVMVPIPEGRVCDINTPEDFSRAEEMYRRLHA